MTGTVVSFRFFGKRVTGTCFFRDFFFYPLSYEICLLVFYVKLQLPSIGRIGNGRERPDLGTAGSGNGSGNGRFTIGNGRIWLQ